MDLHIAPFRFDVSPPMGHSLCGGWIKPVVGYDDPLEAIGLVLLGPESPVVICAVDWTGILNDSHRVWRAALAEAAHTTPERVAVHCVHQHNAPFACLESQAIIAEQGDLPSIIDPGFFQQCLDQGRAAVEKGLRTARKVTHVGFSEAPVNQVASNRRHLSPDGKIRHWRGSSCKDPKLQALAEGLIDPWLKTVAFYDGAEKIASCHYYATHPMSYYGDGRVSSDFVGLARKRRQQDDPKCTQIYFTGCAGNIAAGKYNDGSPAKRVELTDRMYQAMVESEQGLKPEPVESLGWSTADLLPPPRSEFSAEDMQSQIAKKGAALATRNRPAFTLTWLRRLEKKVPITLSALHLNNTSILHLPSESFLEYQLRAQTMKPGRFVAAAAYGDGGPWYIPTADAYPQGGYEVTVAFCDPGVDDALTTGIRALLGG